MVFTVGMMIPDNGETMMMTLKIFEAIIGCLQWRKFGISVDGQAGRKSIHWRHFKI
jgi:hypothetical protein